MGRQTSFRVNCIKTRFFRDPLTAVFVVLAAGTESLNQQAFTLHVHDVYQVRAGACTIIETWITSLTAYLWLTSFQLIAVSTRNHATAPPDKWVSSLLGCGVEKLRNLPRPLWDRPWMAPIERVVLVHRLREVVAQVSFTRFESAAPDIEGELDIGVKRASLAREISWLPAFENKGEGVLLQFRTEAIKSWLGRTAVQKRGIQLGAGFEAW